MVQVYLDANIVIYYVEQHPLYFPQLKTRLLTPARPVQLVYSDLVRMETRVLPMRLGDYRLLERFDGFFAALGISPVHLSRNVFDLATQLRAEHRLKTPDALHLAAAIAAGCDEFWTNDNRLAQAAQGRLQLVTFESNT